MARSSRVCAALVSFVMVTVAQAATSPIASYIQNRDYRVLSTSDPIGAFTAADIDKASGIAPSIAGGLVSWADGRSGSVVVAGFDLVKPLIGEYLVSDETDAWQEGNPFVGVYPGGERRVMYDAAKVAIPAGDLGQVLEYRYPILGSRTAVDLAGLQRSPVFVNVAPTNTQLAWINDTGAASQFNGYNNTEIHTSSIAGSPVYPLGVTNNLTPAPAPRDNLAGDGRYLVWQEIRVHDPFLETSSWDVVVHDLSGVDPTKYINGPTAGGNQILPDVAGNLVVWTQEEDPGGTGATNIYFQDLASNRGPVAITTGGAATNPAISHVFVGGAEQAGEGPTAEQAIEAYFVVWQDHAADSTASTYPGGNGEIDFHWDIWGQEIRFDGELLEWDPYLDPFPILGSALGPVSLAGRQTRPDIDGLDVVWQSQGTGTEDVFVWGPAVPEPCTILLLGAGTPLLLGARRRFLKRHQ